ncbi:MAG: Peptidase, M56 domain protein [candidate division WWE3 bacterium GW2011_GWC2_44_9]|uniref:Peptidase, M56 domain protein n=2 Tax=Katanobacteria TaxID=422282 RepID=A0A0G1NIM2_UNCKA|nr:MAG: Peptidase, M56 domain protein [candidate division WWE3 bacterium GW2011_GWC2_44_9]OGC53203.1 MAG: hypothetical protein A2709_02585 [candidate division WWE3 bacterium RIFCSPHIGHO2_01_FULL_43_9]
MKRANYSFICLTFTALTVSSIVTALLYKAFPLLTSKALYFCQKYISTVMFEVPRSLPNALILAIGVVLVIGIASFLLQLIKTRVFLRKLLINRVDLSSNLVRVLENINLKKAVLIKDKNLVSFCCGTFSPVIVITTGLVGSLTTKELEAVLLHEQAHLLSRDPFKVLIGKTFSSMFFFLPIFRELHKNIEAANEMLADQWAVSRQQNSAFLRGALKKILAAPQLDFVAVSNISGSDYFEIRIHRLVNPGKKHEFKPSLASLATTFLFFFVSLFLLRTPVRAFHTDSMSNSSYFLCSTDQVCPSLEKSLAYIPSHPFLPEEGCNDNVTISNPMAK